MGLLDRFRKSDKKKEEQVPTAQPAAKPAEEEVINLPALPTSPGDDDADRNPGGGSADATLIDELFAQQIGTGPIKLDASPADFSGVSKRPTFAGGGPAMPPGKGKGADATLIDPAPSPGEKMVALPASATPPAGKSGITARPKVQMDLPPAEAAARQPPPATTGKPAALPRPGGGSAAKPTAPARPA
ncbi:MAG: hypothetical protein HY719_05810, partial [Planctomycetes bacterium]|nr:hypothetical protein [Planctomycetota bacterium]